MLTSYAVRVNKIPYLLWFTNGIRLDIDFKKMQIQNEHGAMKSKITQVNPLQIFFMKYLPILLLLIVGGVVPDSLKEWALLGTGISIAFLVLYVFIYHTQWFKLFILIGSAFVWTYMLNGGDASNFERILLYSIEALIIGYVIFEISSGRLEKYYFLEDIESEISVKNERKKKPIIKIWNKEFLQVNSGYDYLKTFRVSGFFIFVGNEIFEEAENENYN